MNKGKKPAPKPTPKKPTTPPARKPITERKGPGRTKPPTKVPSKKT